MDVKCVLIFVFFFLQTYVAVQICERSLTGGQGGHTMPPVQSFVRGEMYSSGYLIRPCEGGGCIIHVVDHYDKEVSLALVMHFVYRFLILSDYFWGRY